MRTERVRSVARDSRAAAVLAASVAFCPKGMAYREKVSSRQ